jgi:hypothetical protein
VLVAVIILSVLGAPHASAQTTVEPPERPSAGAMFTDNPAIVDAHPMPVASWSRFADDRALAVHFTTGTPQCYGVHATTQETADTVTVEFRSGTLPEAVGRACIMIALEGTLQVPLSAPLGDRRVLSVY